jgi:hypothetical protein
MESREASFQFDFLNRCVALVRKTAQTKFSALPAEVFVKQLDLPKQASTEMKDLVHFKDQVTGQFAVQQMANLLG